MTDRHKFLLSAILFFGLSTGIAAQDAVRGDTVGTRARPDYDALGTRVRSFTLYTDAALEFVWDDNILAADQDDDEFLLSDLLVTLAPRLEMRSDWSKHALNFGASALAGRFNEYASQDFTDYSLFADGAFEFGPNELIGIVRHSHLHELRTNQNQQGIFPTEYDVDNFGLRYNFAPNRFYLGLAADLSNYQFEDAVTIVDGSPELIDNSDRDRVTSEFRARGGYRVSPSTSVFLESRLYDFDYDTDIDRFGNNRDTEGYDIVAGSDFDLSGVTFGEFFLGYRKVKYADPVFETQDGPLFGLSLDWNLTPLTTLSVLGAQRLYGTTVPDASGIEAVELGFSVDHELRRNVILNLAFQNVDEDFLNISREDEVKNLNLGVKYLLNRNWRLNAGYTYQKRDSNVQAGQNYRINQFFLGIVGQI